MVCIPLVSCQICRLLKGVSALSSQHSKFNVEELGTQKKRNTFQIAGKYTTGSNFGPNLSQTVGLEGQKPAKQALRSQ